MWLSRAKSKYQREARLEKSNNLEQRASGPDSITILVWKQHAEILTPILSHIWILSLPVRELSRMYFWKAWEAFRTSSTL